MLNLTVREMTFERIKEWLRDVDKMINHYKGKGKVDSCPLCRVISGTGCGYCLWRIIERMDCEEFAKELYDYKELYGSWSAATLRRDLRFKKWGKLRLTQLPRWKKILKAELKRRAEVGA